MRDFEQRSAQFETASRSWMDGNDDAKSAALSDLDDFFKRYPASRPAAPIDPKKLPWRSPEPTTRQPAETKTAWFQNMWGQPKVTLAASGGSIGPINFDVMPEPGQAPTEADLAQTPETQLTPAITAKAAELGNNPLTIHNWVRNNLDWLPTWGAVQSADDTLAKKRGNAHDIASLEIALLRASKIPARYQYGTIEVDADKLQNWVGGVNKVEAALQLLGQGGIANRGFLQGGRVAKVRMEHVWVQAYVNWLPARGAKQGVAGQHVNPIGGHNAWVPLDASYKQYTYKAGLDINTAVALDGQALLTTARQGATVNESEGWVQNLNQVAIQAQVTNYQARIKAYIDSTNASADVGYVNGKKILPQLLPSLLSGSAPYAVVQMGQQAAQVPGNLEHQFRLQLFRAQDGDVDQSNPLLTYQEKTARLAGKRLTLSYVPATQADVDLVASYVPKAHADGSPVAASEFPASLPAYLIRVVPQIQLDGQVVVKGTQPLTIGTDLVSSAGFTRFASAVDWDETQAESHVAGQATAIGLSLQGISAAQLTTLKARLETARSQLQGAEHGDLTTEQLVGDLLTATIWSWFAAGESQSRLTQAAANITENPGMSYGFFHTAVQPIYSWGVVRQVKFPGANIDIPHVRSLTVSKSANASEWVTFHRLRGQYMSALEHAVPAHFINDTSICNMPDSSIQHPGLPTCARGVSAMQALAVAGQSGQRIYTVTPEKYSTNPSVVNQLSAHSSLTLQKVRSYLDAGYEVTIHQSPVAIDGWVGTGFVAIDPSTGAGGYLIEGGSNGGWLPYVMGAMLSFAAVPVFMLLAGTGIGALIVGGALLIYGMTAYIGAINKILATTNLTEDQRSGSIKLISALTAVANIGAGLKAGADSATIVFITLMSAMLTLFKVALDWIISLYENMPSFKPDPS
ncbi:transglutaminase [Pelomonas sp. HMWF004]|nr:transglutaminase [Pelomonas sp. HMWF004]